jgi:hypothetical protein
MAPTGSNPSPSSSTKAFRDRAAFSERWAPIRVSANLAFGVSAQIESFTHVRIKPSSERSCVPVRCASYEIIFGPSKRKSTQRFVVFSRSSILPMAGRPGGVIV